MRCRDRQGRTQPHARIAVAASLALLSAAGVARAECALEHATYADRENRAVLQFAPTGEAAAVTNSFKLTIGDELALDGIVMWTEGVARPNGMLMHKCPDGDVTGEELIACTAWQGVIYTVDGSGTVGLLPDEGAPAPKTLVLPDLGPALSAWSSAYGESELVSVPWDVFAFKGCQK